MALSTASDYQTALFKILYVSKAVSVDEWVRAAGMTRTDANQLKTEFKAWRLALPGRINQTHITTAHS